MRPQSLFLAASLIMALTSCAFHSRSPARAERRANEEAARTAALEWLQLLDAGEYSDAYDLEAARVRAGGTARQFNRSMQARRAPLGGTLSRKMIGVAFSRKMPGAPDGNYESVLFRTTFRHKTSAAERVILAHESGRWRVTDYRVY